MSSARANESYKSNLPHLQSILQKNLIDNFKFQNVNDCDVRKLHVEIFIADLFMTFIMDKKVQEFVYKFVIN